MLYLNQKFNVSSSRLESSSIAITARSLKRIRCRWRKSQTRLSESEQSRMRKRERKKERESSIHFKSWRQMAEDYHSSKSNLSFCATSVPLIIFPFFVLALIQFCIIVIIPISARTKVNPFAGPLLSCSIVCERNLQARSARVSRYFHFDMYTKARTLLPNAMSTYLPPINLPNANQTFPRVRTATGMITEMSECRGIADIDRIAG